MRTFRNKRSARNILIHKKMQREFSMMLITLLIVTVFLVNAAIVYTIQQAAFGGDSFQFGNINPHQVISEVRYLIVMRVTIILFMALIALAFYGVTFLHRVAGPIYRCRKTMIELNRGDIPRQIKLREGDFFEELAEEINKQSNLWAKEVEQKEALKEDLLFIEKNVKSSDVKERIKDSLSRLEA